MIITCTCLNHNIFCSVLFYDQTIDILDEPFSCLEYLYAEFLPLKRSTTKTMRLYYDHHQEIQN